MRLSVQDMTRTAIFTALICLASLILRFGGDMIVPFSILPLMVMLAGGILGGSLGALSVSLFVVIGLVGIPVFAKTPYGGLTYIFQPSFGFLLGSIPAAWVIGKYLQLTKGKGLVNYLIAMFFGIAVMYLIGLPYLFGIIKFFLGKPFTFWQAVKIGMLPFIGLDLLKGLLAAVVARAIKRRIAP